MSSRSSLAFGFGICLALVLATLATCASPVFKEDEAEKETYSSITKSVKDVVKVGNSSSTSSTTSTWRVQVKE